MNEVPAALLVMLASAADSSAIEAGDHLFVRAQLVDCGGTSRVVDHAQITDDGDAVFAGGIELDVAGLNADQIAILLADRIGEATGHTPKTLVVEVVSASDTERVVGNLRALLESSRCKAGARERHLGDPLPAEGHNRRIASSASMLSIEDLAL